MNATTRPDCYAQITELIIALLETGTVPWRKPWKAQTGIPRNLVSGHPYRGINVFLLHSMHYESPYWLTFKQALDLGGHIRKGEKACPVVFWKQWERENPQTGEAEKIRMLRLYHVFNVAQCENLKNVPDIAAPVTSAPTPATNADADAIIAGMPQRPEIKHGLAKAFYAPALDYVGMPNRERFETEDAYFQTLFHELTHATGHASRLNRPTLTETAGFGSNPYCKEELVAEMGAAFLCGHANIGEASLENSAAYIQGWLQQLKNDKKLIVLRAGEESSPAPSERNANHEYNREPHPHWMPRNRSAAHQPSHQTG